MAVYYNAHKDSWVVRIRQGSELVHIGTYASLAEAEYVDRQLKISPKPPRRYSRAWFEWEAKRQAKTLPYRYEKGGTNVPSKDHTW